MNTKMIICMLIWWIVTLLTFGYLIYLGYVGSAIFELIISAMLIDNIFSVNSKKDKDVK